MSDFHVVIATERRVSTKEKPRALASPINNDLRVQTGVDGQGRPTYDVTPRSPQLHTLGARLDHPEDTNITYASEWDGRTPWIVVHKGSIAVLKMAYAGWPMVTQAEWEAAHPLDPVK